MAFSDYGPTTNTSNRQLTNYKPTPQYKLLSNEQQRCIGQMLSFFKGNKEVIYKLRIKDMGNGGNIIATSGGNIYEWLDGILSEGQYFSSQSDMLNTMRGCWLENRD